MPFLLLDKQTERGRKEDEQQMSWCMVGSFAACLPSWCVFGEMAGWLFWLLLGRRNDPVSLNSVLYNSYSLTLPTV